MDTLIVIVAMSVFVYCAYLFYLFFDRLMNSGDNTQLSVSKWDALGDAISSMTIVEITIAVGGSERSTVARLCRLKIKCANFDGSISFEDRELAQKEANLIGTLVQQLICPHCQTQGQVYKKLNADKVATTTDTTSRTSAVLSGTQRTVSKVTQLHCKHCSTTWTI